MADGQNIDASTLQMDGSVEQAALMMPDLDDDGVLQQEQPRRRQAETEDVPPKQRVQNRQNDGRYDQGFTEREVEAQAQAEEQDSEASEIAEEWFELPPEKEGEAPRRLKAEDVFKGYQEAAELRAQLEETRRVSPPPVQYDEEIVKTAQTRHRMIQELDTLMALNQPRAPNDNLLNDQSSEYNPAEYHRQMALYREQAQRIQHIRAERERQQEAMREEYLVGHKAHVMREQAKLIEFWPELKDPAMQRQVRDEAARYLGITEKDFDMIHDSRFYRVLKHALNDIRAGRQRQNAVKVVRAKPKLVRGPARDPSSPKQQAYSQSMRRLADSGGNDIDAAADALASVL